MYRWKPTALIASATRTIIKNDIFQAYRSMLGFLWFAANSAVGTFPGVLWWLECVQKGGTASDEGEMREMCIKSWEDTAVLMWAPSYDANHWIS